MNAPKRQVFKINATESVAVETVGSKVNISFLMFGIKAADKPIPAEVSQALGAALTLHGKEAAAMEANNA